MTAPTRYRAREATAIRRAACIDEAIRLIGRQGYNGSTLQQLAARCGVTNAGLLYHFGSKDRLLIALLEELERREAAAVIPLAEAAARAPRATTAAKAALVALFRAFVIRFTEEVELARFTVVLQCEALDPGHPAHAWFRDREARALEVFAQLVAPWSAAPALLARRLLALKDGLALQWMRSGGGFDLADEWAQGVADLLARPAAGPSAA